MEGGGGVGRPAPHDGDELVRVVPGAVESLQLQYGLLLNLKEEVSEGVKGGGRGERTEEGRERWKREQREEEGRRRREGDGREKGGKCTPCT